MYRQMLRLVLTGGGYLLLSLVVGSFLIRMMEAVASDNLYLTRKTVYFFNLLDVKTIVKNIIGKIWMVNSYNLVIYN